MVYTIIILIARPLMTSMKSPSTTAYNIYKAASIFLVGILLNMQRDSKKITPNPICHGNS